LNALQLVFMRFEGKQLNPRDTYESDWVGAEGGGPGNLFAKGQALSGIFGKYEADLHGLGVSAIPQLRVRAATSEVDPAKSGTDQLRTWQSSDGKFSVEATLVEVLGDQATLRRADRKVIRVPLSRLSDADQEYVRKRKPAE
jgi:hypothetical protein